MIQKNDIIRATDVGSLISNYEINIKDRINKMLENAYVLIPVFDGRHLNNLYGYHGSDGHCWDFTISENMYVCCDWWGSHADWYHNTGIYKKPDMKDFAQLGPLRGKTWWAPKGTEFHFQDQWYKYCTASKCKKSYLILQE